MGGSRFDCGMLRSPPGRLGWQATGTVLVGAAGYLLMTLIVLVVGVVGLRLGVALFDREAILTRWR